MALIWIVINFEKSLSIPCIMEMAVDMVVGSGDIFNYSYPDIVDNKLNEAKIIVAYICPQTQPETTMQWNRPACADSHCLELDFQAFVSYDRDIVLHSDSVHFQQHNLRTIDDFFWVISMYERGKKKNQSGAGLQWPLRI